MERNRTRLDNRVFIILTLYGFLSVRSEPESTHAERWMLPLILTPLPLHRQPSLVPRSVSPAPSRSAGPFPFRADLGPAEPGNRACRPGGGSRGTPTGS